MDLRELSKKYIFMLIAGIAVIVYIIIKIWRYINDTEDDSGPIASQGFFSNLPLLGKSGSYQKSDESRSDYQNPQLHGYHVSISFVNDIRHGQEDVLPMARFPNPWKLEPNKTNDDKYYTLLRLIGQHLKKNKITGRIAGLGLCYDDMHTNVKLNKDNVAQYVSKSKTDNIPLMFEVGKHGRQAQKHSGPGAIPFEIVYIRNDKPAFGLKSAQLIDNPWDYHPEQTDADKWNILASNIKKSLLQDIQTGEVDPQTDLVIDRKLLYTENKQKFETLNPGNAGELIKKAKNKNKPLYYRISS